MMKKKTVKKDEKRGVVIVVQKEKGKKKAGASSGNGQNRLGGSEGTAQEKSERVVKNRGESGKKTRARGGNGMTGSFNGEVEKRKSQTTKTWKG